jgi:VCBS repeat-containing protein
VKNVTLSSQIYDGKEDEKGVVNNLLGGMQTFLDVVVKEGYDPDSVKVIQEVNGEVVDTIELYGGNAYHGRDRWCDIKLLPGANVFYATAPKKATYKINLPEGTAYTIELVNGSKTTVDYGGSFSFKIKGKEGYDLSDMVVTADGQRMTADKNGIYTLTNIKNDYDIGVAGYKTNSFIVTFKDYNGNVIGKSQTVDFGKNATAPATPSRKGYTFAGWDRSFSNVKQNLVVTATYKQIFVNKIEISGDITKLAPEKTVTLKAAVTPENALNTGVIWTSGNTKYATVDANGKVKALKAGAGKKVTITATAKDGSGKKAVYKIAIQKKAVKKIKLSAKSKSVKPGKKVTVKATVSPSKGINKTLVWTSSNEKYATVNSKGVVTTKKAGKGKTVVITAKSTDGSGKKATIKIKIKKK